VGICKRTIEMVEVRSDRRVENSGAKRIRKIDERSRCFFDRMGIHFKRLICSRTLGKWYNLENASGCCVKDESREIGCYLAF
jgi:hypothetical protein